jgi:hypothetical protein
MAIVVPIVSEFADKGIVAAQAGFNNFKNKVAEADGAMGKFKAGAGAALDAVKANAGQFAAAAGAAIGAFAVKAIGEFQDLALAADKFANATGIAVEEASAFIEVAGDLGIETEVLQKAINKMNLAIAKGSDEFGALGVEVARNERGLIDSNETFIRTVGALSDVNDSTERARLATAVFGKSWGDMSEIIKGGAPALRAAIASVSDAKIIDPREVERAKELRAAQDALKDAFEDVTLAVGSALLPALVKLLETAQRFGDLITGGPVGKGIDLFGKGARILTDALNPLDSVMAGVNRVSDSTASAWERGYGAIQTLGGVLPGVNSALDSLGGWLFGTSKETKRVYDATEILNETWAKSYQKAGEMRYAGLRLANAIRELDDDTNGLIDTFDALLDQFERDEAVDGLTDAFKTYQTTVLEALGKGTPEAAAEAERAMRSLVREMATVAKQAQLTSEEQVEIVALLEKGQYDLAYAELLKQLAAVPRQIPIQFIGSVSGIPVPAGQTPSETIGGGFPGTNPMLPQPPKVGGGTGGAKGGSLPIVGRYSDAVAVNVTVQGSVITELDLIESIRKGLVNSQRSGKQLVYSNT